VDLPALKGEAAPDSDVAPPAGGPLRWIVAAALALVLTACQSVSISFPNARLDANDREIETVSGLLAIPEGKGPFPAVVLLHSCGGFTSHVTHDWPGYLAEIGFVALSVDTFGSRGYQRCPNPYWGARATFVKDAYGALDYLAAQPFVDRNRIAVMGFSLGTNHINGGLIPWRVRAFGGLDFKAAIGFYGHCTHIGPYPRGSIPLMQIGAEHDPAHAPGCAAAARAHPEIEVHILPGAYHAFDSKEASGRTGAIGERMEYSAEATRRARELVRAFLEKHLVRTPGS
jgi:dienelactone hydrolase